MYTEYWKLERKPFESAPDPEFFYHAPLHAEAFERLSRLIVGRQGAGVLTGACGSGKTMLLKVLDAELDLERFPVVMLKFPRLTGDEAAREILRQLDVEPSDDPAERKERLGERLLATSLEGGHTLVIVDEAHIISHDEVLEELGRLLDFRLDGEFMATLLMVGEPAVLQRVARKPRFDQRLVVRQHLDPLDTHQTHAYIGYRLEVAGADGPLFTEAAVEHVHARTGGVPREINSMCDMSLMVGARKRAERITEEIARMVA